MPSARRIALPTPIDKSCLVVSDFEVLITDESSAFIMAASVKVPPVSKPSIVLIFVSLRRVTQNDIYCLVAIRLSLCIAKEVNYPLSDNRPIMRF